MLTCLHFLFQSKALRRKSKSHLRSSKRPSRGRGRHGRSQVSSIPPPPYLTRVHSPDCTATPLPPTDQSSAQPTQRQRWTVQRDERRPVSRSPKEPPPPPLLLLLQFLTPALHWRHQIRTSNIHIRQLYREFELYEEKRTLMIFFFCIRLYTIVLMRWSVWHLAT